MDTTLDATIVWEQVLKKLEQELSKLMIDTWLRPTIPLNLTETTLEIGTDKQITKEWLESRYLPIISSAVHSVTNKILDVVFTYVGTDNRRENIDKKRISVSYKRQITIPIEFYKMLGISSEVDCYVKDGALIIKPIRSEYTGEFVEKLLEDLVAQGLSGEQLLSKFREMNHMTRPTIEVLSTYTDVANLTTNEQNNSPENVDTEK